MPETTTDPTMSRLQDIVAQIMITDPTELTLETYLEEDLSMDLEKDLPRIIARANQEFNIKVDSDEIIEEATTFGELLSIIEDEIELG